MQQTAPDLFSTWNGQNLLEIPQSAATPGEQRRSRMTITFPANLFKGDQRCLLGEAMANLSERRRFERKRIRLRCHLVMDTGLAIEGYTRDFSHEGLFLQTHGIPSTQRHKEPSPGDQALLIIHFTREKRPESIRTTCRLVHLSSAGIGVYFSFSALTRQDQEAIVKILDAETANI